jgi:hypothetical protein
MMLRTRGRRRKAECSAGIAAPAAILPELFNGFVGEAQR